LLANPPVLHVDRDGRATSWKVSNQLLTSLDGLLHEGERTLETGAGVSTLLFAMRHCHHQAVVPDPDLAQRIKDWCGGNGVPTDRLEFVLGRSEDELPRLSEDGPLDLVLIDGAHGFPAPFLDWFYAARRIRPGGYVVIDDTQIWTGDVLRRFLASERQWRPIHRARYEFAVFQRLEDGPVGEWHEQPYVLRHSWVTRSSSLHRRLVGSAATAARNARAATELIRRGDFETLRSKLRSR
jgi:predicted O-methyltransferase YrrM